MIPIDGIFLPPAFIHAKIVLKRKSRNGTATTKTMYERNHRDMDVTDEVLCRKLLEAKWVATTR